MNRMKVIAAAALLLMILSACGSLAKQSASYVQISQQEAAEMMQEEPDYILLDVRTYEEYQQEHIPGAICIPNETIAKTQPEELPLLDQKILVYCRSGNRSKQAAQKLADMGYTNVFEFGGIISWTGETVSG